MIKTRKHSTAKMVSIAVAIMAISNILSRLLGFVRMMVLANSAGAGANVDAYSFSFMIPDLINHMLAGSALSITFIPMFQEIIATKGEKKGMQFFSNIFTIGTILFVIITALTLVYTDSVLLLFSGKNIKADPEQFKLTVMLTRIIMPAQLFFFWGALFNGIQYSKKKFLLPALTPIVYNIGIILGGVILYPYIGIAGFSWGVLAGAFIGNVVIQYFGAKKAGMKIFWRFDIKDKATQKWFLITTPFILGLGMTFSNEILLRIFGSMSSDGAGSIASLDYSYKAMMFLVGVFGQSVAAGTYPFISQLAADKKFSEMNKFISDMLVKVSTISIPFTLIALVVADILIDLLFQRGNFTSENSTKVASVFVFYLPATFFMAGGLVMVRAFYALKKTVTPLIISTLSLGIALPFFPYLGNKIGVKGVAASSSIMVFVTFIGLLITWERVSKEKFVLKFLTVFIKIIIFSLPGMFLTMWLRGYAENLTLNLNPLLKNVSILIFSAIPSLIITALIFQYTEIFDSKTVAILSYKKVKKILRKSN